MELLNRDHIAKHSEIKQKQEFKYLGATRKRKRLKLFALNHDTGEVYEVKLEVRKAYDVTTKRENSIYKAVINPSHKPVFALNLKNAKRKLMKFKIKYHENNNI